MENSRKPAIRFAGFTEAWEQRKLGEMCDEFQSGSFISASEIHETGLFPVYGGNGLRGYTDTYNHDGVYALIGRQGALCGNMNISKEKAYFTEHAVACKGNKFHDTEFLFYLFSTLNLGQYSGQSAQPGLAVGNLIEVTARTPSKAEQVAISTFLGSLDDLITLHQRKRDRLQNVKKSMLEKMFPKNGSNVPEIRFAGFTEAWEQRKLGDIVKSHNAGIYVSKEKYGQGKNIVGVGDIYGSDSIDGQTFRFAPVQDEKFILDENDLIYGESSLVPEGIARTMYVTKNGAGTAFAWHTRRVKIDNELCSSHIATLELNYNKSVRNYLMRASTQTALTGMTTEGFFGSTITYPSMEEQDKISAFFVSLDNLITLHQRKLEKLENMKKSMLEKMFVSSERRTI